MRTITESVKIFLEDYEIDLLDCRVDFSKVVARWLKRRIADYGYPVEILNCSHPDLKLYQVSDIIVEAESSEIQFESINGEETTRETIVLSLYGIDSDGDCLSFDLGDINDFSIERVALIIRELPNVEFRVNKVLKWLIVTGVITRDQ